MQERGVLRDHADGRTQTLLSHRADVLAVDADAALLHFVKAEQQVHERGLACARSADQSHAFAGTDGQVQVVEYALSVGAAVRERHVLEPDLAAGNLELARSGPVNQRVRHGDGFHAFLDDADVLEDSRDFPAYPAGHVGDLPGQGQRGGHDTGADQSVAP